MPNSPARSTPRNLIALTAALWLTGCATGGGLFTSAPAPGVAVDQSHLPLVQRQVRDLMVAEYGGGNPEVFFNDAPKIRQISGAEGRIEGTGMYLRSPPGPQAKFFYTAVVNARDQSVHDIRYEIVDDPEQGGEDGRMVGIAKQAAITRVQDEYGPNAEVKIMDAKSYVITGTKTGVRGAGLLKTSLLPNKRRFYFNVVVNNRSGKVVQIIMEGI